MSYKLAVSEESQLKRGLACDVMKVGDLARIVGDSVYCGNIVLYAYERFVVLGDPSQTWREDWRVEVELLPSGTKVVLKVE